MRFLYPAESWHAGTHEVVVSFRDIRGCHTSGVDEADALEEAQDALAEAIAGHINRGDPIPAPSATLPGEYLVAVPTDIAANAALVLAFRDSGLTHASLAERLGTDEETVRRMLDPRDDTAPSPIHKEPRILGSELVVEVRDLVSA